MVRIATVNDAEQLNILNTYLVQDSIFVQEYGQFHGKA